MTTSPPNAAFLPPCDRRGPLFGPNRMKLAVFGINVSSAAGVTAAKDRHEIGWAQNVRLTQEAERAGFEAVVPFARFRGFEGATNPWGHSFETYTWAAGLAALTSRIGVVCTSHVLTISPIMAAKQLSTIDHISNGRVALNVVSGWFRKELDMFGVGALDHDARYRYAAEWIEVMQRLWTQDQTFDFDGEHIKVKDGYQQPKSIQSPRPPVMNAALSPVGNAFAAKRADIAFVAPNSTDPGPTREKVDALRAAAADHGRQIQVWVPAVVYCGDTEAAARDEMAHFLEREADPVALDNQLDWMMGGARMSPALRQHMKTQGGLNLLGTPQQIAETIAALADAGVDGLCLEWMNYERGLPRFVEQVLPRLEQASLREAAARYNPPLIPTAARSAPNKS